MTRRPLARTIAARTTRALLGAVLAASLTRCGQSPMSPQPPPRPRLLVVTHTTGFRHSSIPTAERVLGELAQQGGLFEVAYCRNAEEVSRMLAAPGLREHDGVFFANTTGDLGIPDLRAFIAWIEEGHPFLGAHSASDTYHNRREYLDMLGGEFLTHGSQTEVEARVEDLSHPAVAHLAPSYRVFDEIYEFRENNRPRVNMLLSLDRHPNDGHPEAGQPGDFPLAWHRMAGRGRVFYTAPGHREDVWESAAFRQHLRGAIGWAFAGN